ncbi:MAG TPA: hypothetical protein VHP33_38745 [Polyangiaceae bacterium]|nr:hypothetical protein [Polyangiaceae bacterium]
MNHAPSTHMDIVPQSAESFRQGSSIDEERVFADGETLVKATLNVPLDAHAVILLIHGGSALRFGAASRFASEVFGQAGFATLQVDLLTPAEEAELAASRHPEDHVPLLSQRVVTAVDWLGHERDTAALPIGLFATSMETVPALMAAERSGRVGAVVSQGGCPDFARDAVGELRVPTLLIVGRDEQARAAELASEFFARHLISPTRTHRPRLRETRP